MKQKIVMKVPMMNDPKCRSKAMKAAVSIPGVISATLEGNDMDQLAVVGADGVDSVKLTTLLRKKMGFTELISLAVVDEKKEEDKKEEEKKIETVVWPTSWAYQYSGPQPLHYAYQDPYRDNCCIM